MNPAPKRWKRVGLPVLRVILLVYLALGLAGLLLSDRIAFQTPPPSYERLQEQTWVVAPDGTRLAGVYLPAPSARHTLLYFHGNAEDVGDTMPLLEAFRRRGLSVASFDYRGYGRSEGRPSEQRVYSDARAVYRYLVRDQSVEPAQIVVLGRSLGGAVAADLAAHEQVGGLVLESTFVSGFRLLCPVPMFPFDKFATRRKLMTLTCPTLHMHGTDDTVVPAWHGQALYESAPGPKRLLLVPGAGHDDLVSHAGDQYFEAIDAFLESLVSRSAGSE